MKEYIVGGHVRDCLLGRASGDRDWVVVGSHHQEMIERHFTQVGQSFPVYIHHNTGEEYALARQERKIATGHGGFEFATETVTLEQDLQRRDLTINAMAMTDSGTIVDPYGGYRDIQSRLLKHISPAFKEDPLRVLRVARFAAQLANHGFRIAPETIIAMTQIVASGELETLPPERIFQETRKALASDMPSKYFLTLRRVGALAILFPELDNLFGVPQNATYHPEVDTGVHVMMVIDQSARLCTSTAVRYACLCHDFGKALTPPTEWPSHKQHEFRGVAVVDSFCCRLKVPKDMTRLALLVCEYHLLGHRMFELKPTTIVKLLNSLDAWRRPQTVDDYIRCCEADSRGRTGFEDVDFVQKEFFLYVSKALLAYKVIPDPVLTSGQAIKQHIYQQRCHQANILITQWKDQHS